MPFRNPTPFERPEVVAPYEDWLGTPYGRWVADVEEELLTGLLAALPTGARVLDLGCGTGWLAQRLARHGWRVVGLDPSAAMLAQASERLPVVRGDGMRLPFADGAFEAVCVTAVLDFVDDPAALLREARRVARVSVAVAALARDSWLALRRSLQGRRGHPIFSRARFHPRARLFDFARAAGAEPERVRGALYLPPSLGPRLPALERALARGTLRGAGLLGFSLRGCAT
jgi:SAM-dependent methyltransferase